MLIAMAGLPGTGKTTVANALAPKLGAVVLNKDSVRAALFPPGTVEYSVEQDDLCFDVMLKVAAFLLKRNPSRPVILDGRTFTQRQQVSSVIQAAQATKAPLAFIECTCAEKVALRRLAQAGSQQAHPAANRDGMLYRRLKATADPISLPHLTVATEAPLAFIVQQCLAYLADRQCEGPEAPDPPRIPGLVALAQHYQRELRKIADQEHSDTNPDDPLIVRISHKLQAEADAIADLCHSEGTAPESLPIRSRRVFKWLRFLSDPANLSLHLSALAHIYKGARRRLAADGTHGTIQALQIEIGPTSMLYRTKTMGGSYQIMVHEGFIGAAPQVLDELVQAALGHSTDSALRRSVRRYGDTDAFAAIQAVLEPAAPTAAETNAPKGRYQDLNASFDRVNRTYFSGEMPRPRLRWSRRPTSRMLGQFDVSRDCITVSTGLDAPNVPAYVVDFVVYHELLHKALGTQCINGRRRIHTPEFRAAERDFRQYDKAQAVLSKISKEVRKR